MTTVVNNPSGNGEGSGVGIIVGVLVVIVILALFFIYGLPAIRGNQAPANNPDINLDVTLPGSGGNTGGGTGGTGSGTGGTGGTSTY